MEIINGIPQESVVEYVDTEIAEILVQTNKIPAEVVKTTNIQSSIDGLNDLAVGDLNNISPAEVNAEVDTALDTIIPAAPTAGSLNDILSSASGGNTFDKSTDSLEAIADKIIAVQGGTDTLYSISQELVAILDVARDPDSTTTTMDGSEQTLHEESAPTKLIQFLGGIIDLTNIVGTRSLLIKVYIKLKSGGSYVQISDDTVNNYTAAIVAATANKTADIDGFFNRYGYKITATQTEAEGYVTIDHEWFNAANGF